MDLKSLLDMSYFWWVFNKAAAFGVIFLVIKIGIEAAGWLLETIVSAFKNFRKS